MIGRDARPGRFAILLGVAAALGLAAAIAAPEHRTATEPPLPAAPLGPVPATRLGVNVGKLGTWDGDYSFANLVLSGSTSVATPHGWVPADESVVDEDGWPRPTGKYDVEYPLGAPSAGAPARIVCTWKGSGRAAPGGSFVRLISSGAGRMEFEWRDVTKAGAWIGVPPQSGSVRDLDCRAADVDRAASFAPDFLKTVAPFRVLRFMDWQLINQNKGGNWATRSTLASSTQTGPDGVAIELIVDLVNQTGADPWLVVPWHADDDYVLHMAQYVHDHLHPGGTAYVELGNEIWNAAFPAAREAQDEGLAEGLSGDRGEAGLRRYAEKAAHVLAIWTRVFADRPRALVRVVSTQAVLPVTAQAVLSFRDTARWVDALATAPYFGYDIFADPNVTTPDQVFAKIDPAIDRAIMLAGMNKAVAQHFGKRYITYEGGQHLTTNNVPLLTAVERDPRMEQAYLRYLRAWQAKIGDTLMLYNLTDKIGGYGAWGLREYAGQPLSETPKLRAVQAFLGK